MFNTRYMEQSNDLLNKYNNNNISNNYNSNGDMVKFNNCYCYKSYFRLLHAVIDAPKVDVYLNEMLMASNLDYGYFSNYSQVMPGNYKLTVYESGKNGSAVVEANIDIGRNTAYTAALSGELPDIENLNVVMIPEMKEHNFMNKMSAVRLINLCPKSPALDLVTDNGVILFSDIEYGEVTDNISLPTNKYTLHLRAAGTEKNILTVPSIEFLPNMYYSLFVIGIYGGKPSIELLIPESGLNNLSLC